jgi:hypothetical protein
MSFSLRLLLSIVSILRNEVKIEREGVYKFKEKLNIYPKISNHEDFSYFNFFNI